MSKKNPLASTLDQEVVLSELTRACENIAVDDPEESAYFAGFISALQMASMDEDDPDTGMNLEQYIVSSYLRYVKMSRLEIIKAARNALRNEKPDEVDDSDDEPAAEAVNRFIDALAAALGMDTDDDD